jgi:hypothetical protein
MIELKETMPDDLKASILTDEVIAIFWRTLPDIEKETYKFFMLDIGVVIGVCTSRLLPVILLILFVY